MGLYNGYALSSGSRDHLDVEEYAARMESTTPQEIESMDLELFSMLSYREQLTIKQNWPNVYDRLIAEMEEERKETKRY